jgi:hypothetical protein
MIGIRAPELNQFESKRKCQPKGSWNEFLARPAAASRAGRKYPNLVDNMNAAKEQQ